MRNTAQTTTSQTLPICQRSNRPGRFWAHVRQYIQSIVNFHSKPGSA